MRLRGGCNVPLAGRPAAEVEPLATPDRLHLPLRSRRFRFTELCVEDGQPVRAGQALAADPSNFSVPLLAPLAGTVRLGLDDGHIRLEGTTDAPRSPHRAEAEKPPPGQGTDRSAEPRQRLLSLGAWQFFHDARTAALPDPFGAADAAIVSTLRLEPFLARGDAQLRPHLPDFLRGLEHLKSLLAGRPVFLVLPKVRSPLADQLRRQLRHLERVSVVAVPLRYPCDHFAVLARGLGVGRGAGRCVWALHTEGVLAIGRALGRGLPCTERIVSVGGPAVASPVHVRTVPGCPLERLLSGRVGGGAVRVVHGGALTGESGTGLLGLDSECTGLTVLPEPERREMLAFLRPGWSRRSYSRCLLGSLRGVLRERRTTALRGETRACVACGLCVKVCPAGIMPNVIHKYLYQDDIDQARRMRVDLCVECGLCAYVCPSKIDLRRELVEARQQVRRELVGQEGRA
jgi:Na+-transporting NADH:ubiquinone oxidoreductase subunit A